MQKMTKYLLIMILIFTVFPLIARMMKNTPSPSSTAPVSMERDESSLIPNFTLFDREGNPVEFDSFRGSPLVVNFWATWCPYCVEELPDFDQAQEEYSGKVTFLYIDMNDGSRETVEKALAYLDREKYKNITTLFDTRGNATDLFKIRSLPTTLFVDREGYLVDYSIGRTSYSRLTGRIDAMLPQE